MSEANEKDPTRVLYLVLCIVMALICAFGKYKGYSTGFFARIGIFIFSLIGAYIGALIGDFLRKLALPDSFYTSGGMFDILKTKFFWAIGPQLIGIVIGGVLGGSLILALCK